jgi:CheY-like chemotaxis protein
MRKKAQWDVLRKPRILVVDDDPVSTKIAGRIGRFGGFEVRETQDPAEVLALARATSPDLVIADVRMPGIDGPELCVLLKSDPWTRSIPILLVSSDRDFDPAELGRFCGGAAFLPKPFTPVKLLRAINRLLGRVTVGTNLSS